MIRVLQDDPSSTVSLSGLIIFASMKIWWITYEMFQQMEGLPEKAITPL
jgi:hypothetical protein